MCNQNGSDAIWMVIEKKEGTFRMPEVIWYLV